METITIMQEIQRLPFSKQMYIAEWLIKTIRQREIKSQMQIAAEELCSDYGNDSELTALTNLDFENFYEAAK